LKIPFINLQAQYKNHSEDIDAAIKRVLEHGQYIMGPEVAELEKKLADYIGVKHVLACSSGTDALIVPLLAKNLTKKDAILTSPFTFFATAEAISIAGATPVFVDIDPETYNIDPKSLAKTLAAIEKDGELTPKGIIPVDLFGISADYDEINGIAKEYDLFVLEDAAQSFAADYKGRKAGSLADIAATSFYPAKPLGCYGDGGAIFTDNTDLYEMMVSLRVHGQSMSGNKYDNVQIGLNARMDTIQAAILLEKLKFYDEEIILREAVASTYNKLLSNSIKTPQVPENQSSVWAQFSIQINDREKVCHQLKENGIPTAIFYPIPIHLSTAYKHLGYKIGDFPVSEHVSKHIVSLPMHPYLEESEIQLICDIINEVS